MTTLVATLHETEQRLEELTRGEVDTVMSASGRPFLLRRAQEELRDSESARQAAILNALPARIALLDANGVITSVNEAWRQYTGGEAQPGPDFGLGLNYPELCDRVEGVHSADAHHVAAGIRAVLQGRTGNFSFEYSNHRPRQPRWHLLTVTPLADAKAKGAVVMHLDITERKLAGAELEALSRQSIQRERILTTTLSSMSDFAYIYDRAGRFTYANAPLLKLLGLTLEQIVGKNFFDLGYPAEVATRLQAEVQEVFETGKSLVGETPYTNHLGKAGHYEYIFSPAITADGTVDFVVGSTRDITERKNIETALRESNEMFHQLADNITDAFWIRSADLREVQYVSPAFEKIWGRSVASLLADPQAWSGFILAEDRARVQAAFDGLTDGHPTLDIEYRIVRPAGEIRWVRVRGFRVRNDTDQLIRHIGIVTDITERKLAEADLQEKTALLEAQLDASLDGILVVDDENRMILHNQRFIDLWQVPPEILAHDDTKLVEFAMSRTKHPQAFADKIRHLYSHRDETSHDEFDLVDGTVLYRYSAPVKGKDGRYYGRIWTFRDITMRRQAEDALRESGQRFKALFEQAAVGVIQADAVTGRLVQVNQRFCAMVGYSPAELQQFTFSTITHPQDLAKTQEMVARVKAGEIREYTLEKRYVRKDGAELWADVTVSAMWAPGETPDYFIVVAQDITERRRLDEHMQQAQKMEALGQFSGGVAHDFNNILAAIGGFTELARIQLEGNPRVAEHLAAVLRSTNRAADLVRQILTFSRQQPQTREVIHLQPVVIESMKLMRATIPSTVEINAAIAADAPTVLANANQVHQVLMNLGINAWHAMKDRPGRVQVSLDKVTVDAAYAATKPNLRPGEYARVSISDNGCGMDPPTMRRIFEPFFTTKAPGSGTGLGLSVVHGIMDSHDGAVTVHSQPGTGTEFCLYFPAQAGEAALDRVAVAAAPHGQGENILVVDDEELLADLAKTVLTRTGYSVTCTSSSDAALELVRAEPRRFALVITDQTMPGMTGLQLASQLKEIRRDLPILLMTGYNLSNTMLRAEETGINNILLKPFTIESLASAVHATLHGKPYHSNGSNPPY